MVFSDAKYYVENKLKGLDKHLTYHNAWHTLGDVLPASERLALLLNVQEDDLIVLKTSALFHDLGYLTHYKNNEPIGANMAEDFLPQCDYTKKQILTIKQLILATKIPQNPKTLLEKILCDADLDSLGRKDYLSISHNLMQEYNFYNETLSTTAWLKKQLDFLRNHSYHTLAAHKLRNEQKQKNRALLENKLKFLG